MVSRQWLFYNDHRYSLLTIFLFFLFLAKRRVSLRTRTVYELSFRDRGRINSKSIVGETPSANERNQSPGFAAVHILSLLFEDFYGTPEATISRPRLPPDAAPVSRATITLYGRRCVQTEFSRPS